MNSTTLNFSTNQNDPLIQWVTLGTAIITFLTLIVKNRANLVDLFRREPKRNSARIRRNIADMSSQLNQQAEHLKQLAQYISPQTSAYSDPGSPESV